MKIHPSVKSAAVCMSLFFGTLIFYVGCDSLMYPSLHNVKTMADAERELQVGLQESTVGTMTEQHTAMTPELEAVFATILATNQDTANALNDLAAGKVSDVEGPGLGGIGFSMDGVFNLLGMGWLIPFWNMFFGKSRGTKEVDSLKKELNELKTDLMTKAGANETLPG